MPSRVDVRRAHLDGRGQIDDGLALGGRLPHVEDGVADFERVFRLVDVIDAVGWGQSPACTSGMDPCAGDAALGAPCARDRSSRMKGIVS